MEQEKTLKYKKDSIASDLKVELTTLEGLKQPFIENSKKYWNEYNGNGINGQLCKYDVNLLFAMVKTMEAEFASSLPVIKFFGLDRKGKKASKIMLPVIQHLMMLDGTHSKIIQMVQSASIDGVGYLYIGFNSEGREVNVTKWKNGSSSISKETIYDNYGPETQLVPYKNVFHNGLKLSSATRVFIKNVLSEQEFKVKYSNNSMYTFDINEVMTNLSTPQAEAEAKEDMYGRYDNVTIVECYDTIDNTYVVIANDVCINLKNGEKQPNPFAHRQVPLTEFVPIPNAKHQYGDTIAEKTEQQRIAYNDGEETIMKGQEAMLGFMGGGLFDDNIEIRKDEESGIRIVNGYSREEVWHYSPQINLSYSLNQQQRIINNMVLVSGIDFTNLVSTNQYETGTSVLGRKQSFQKRINLAIKSSYMDTFNRLVYQMLSNIQNLYDFKKKDLNIPFRGKNIEKIEAAENKGFLKGLSGLFTKKASTVDTVASSIKILQDDIEGGIDFFLDSDMLIGASRQAQFEEMQQAVTMLSGLRNKDGSAFVGPEQLLKIMNDMFSYINFGEILGSNNINNNKAQGNIDDKVAEHFGGNKQLQNMPQQQVDTTLPTQGSRSNLG